MCRYGCLAAGVGINDADRNLQLGTRERENVLVNLKGFLCGEPVRQSYKAKLVTETEAVVLPPPSHDLHCIFRFKLRCIYKLFMSIEAGFHSYRKRSFLIIELGFKKIARKARFLFSKRSLEMILSNPYNKNEF